LSRPSANITYSNAGSWSCASSLTVRAQNCGVNRQGFVDSEYRFFEGEVNSEKRVLSPLSPRLRPSWSAAEEGLKNVPKSKRLISPAVIAGALLLVRENFVRMSDQLKALLSFWGRVYVRVKFTRQFPVCLLDFILGRVPAHPEYFVVI
jgi:hypothetical protein